ncbi:Bdr family repetitive protein [Borrelia crocidurae]|nr:Bdr family repetitive protein [Borrelia crocidurae]
MEYIQMEPIITRQMVLNELVKAGINREIADDLSYRYYKNELTTKDLQYLESNFNFKLEILERGLKADIKELDNKIDTVENNLNNKIDKVRDELKSDIKELDNKIDTVENNLNNKIDTKFKELDNKIDTVENNLNNKIDKVRDELKSDIKELDNKIDIVRKDMELNKMELDTKIDKFASEVKGTLKLHAWMFGTIITINVGIFLALISMLYALFIK